jgi:hypothetical protein
VSLISYKRGQGSIVLRVKILDSAASTGAGKTGLTNASSGLVVSTIADNEASATVYTGGNLETISTLGTFAAPTAGKCRFKEVDSTNHKGVYEIQIADARYAVSSAKSLLVSISGASGAAETDVVIPLVDLDPYDAQRAGLAALPSTGTSAKPADILANASYTILADSNGAVTLNQSFPANFSNLSIDANGVMTIDSAALVDAIWDEATSGHATAGTTGKALTDASTTSDLWATSIPGVYTAGQAGYIVGTNLNATVSSRSTLAAGAQMDLVNAPNATALSAIAAAVWTATTRTLTSLSALVGSIADAVWDELLADHTTVGSAAAKLSAAASTGEVVNSSPVSLDGTELYLTIGYDYSNGADSQPCVWNDSDGAWPSLANATVTMVVKDTETGNAAFSANGVVGDVGTANQSVTISVTANNTETLEAEEGRYAFYVKSLFSADSTTRLLAWGWVFPRSNPPYNNWE